MFGPFEAPVFKVRNKYRMRIVIKFKNNKRARALFAVMLSEYGNGTFQLIEFEDDLLLILIGDYTPKDTFEKITEISEDYMEISQFETDSSSFKIGGRKKNQVDKGIYCYLNTQKKTYTYCEGGKPVRFTKVILSPKYFNTYFRLHDRNNAELLNLSLIHI